MAVVLVLLPVLLALLAVGSPFLRLEQGIPGADSMPAGLESRDAYLALQSEFGAGETNPITVLVDVEDRREPSLHTIRVGPLN